METLQWDGNLEWSSTKREIKIQKGASYSDESSILREEYLKWYAKNVEAFQDLRELFNQCK